MDIFLAAFSSPAFFSFVNEQKGIFTLHICIKIKNLFSSQ